MTYRGKIAHFVGNHMSGLATLLIQRADGVIDNVPCENAPTVRALQSCFGNIIGPGHTARIPKEAQEIEIVYTVDDLGLLCRFTPSDKWEGPEIPDEGMTDKDLIFWMEHKQ